MNETFYTEAVDKLSSKEARNWNAFTAVFAFLYTVAIKNVFILHVSPNENQKPFETVFFGKLLHYLYCHLLLVFTNKLSEQK